MESCSTWLSLKEKRKEIVFNSFCFNCFRKINRSINRFFSSTKKFQFDWLYWSIKSIDLLVKSFKSVSLKWTLLNSYLLRIWRYRWVKCFPFNYHHYYLTSSSTSLFKTIVFRRKKIWMLQNVNVVMVVDVIIIMAPLWWCNSFFD